MMIPIPLGFVVAGIASLALNVLLLIHQWPL